MKNPTLLTNEEKKVSPAERAPSSGRQQPLHASLFTVSSGTGSTSHDTAGLLGCYQADNISNMAASSSAEQTQLQDMEEEDAGMEEREMESDEGEEEGMGEENSDDDEDDSSEDEKENEAEIQRLEEQVINVSQQPCQARLTNVSVSRRANENEWMVNTVSYNKSEAFESWAALSWYNPVQAENMLMLAADIQNN